MASPKWFCFAIMSLLLTLEVCNAYRVPPAPKADTASSHELFSHPPGMFLPNPYRSDCGGGWGDDPIVGGGCSSCPPKEPYQCCPTSCWNSPSCPELTLYLNHNKDRTERLKYPAPKSLIWGIPHFPRLPFTRVANPGTPYSRGSRRIPGYYQTPIVPVLPNELYHCYPISCGTSYACAGFTTYLNHNKLNAAAPGLKNKNEHVPTPPEMLTNEHMPTPPEMLTNEHVPTPPEMSTNEHIPTPPEMSTNKHVPTLSEMSTNEHVPTPPGMSTNDALAPVSG